MGVSDMDVTVDQATSDMLLALAMGESGVMGEAMEMREQLRADSSLDAKTFALVKIAALVALDAAPASYLFQVQGALDAGASPREILGVTDCGRAADRHGAGRLGGAGDHDRSRPRAADRNGSLTAGASNGGRRSR